MRNFFIAIIAFVFLSGCGETSPEGESSSLKSPRPTSITEGENDKFITAMKQSVGREELRESYQLNYGTNVSPILLKECKEWKLVKGENYVFGDLKPDSYNTLKVSGWKKGLVLGMVRYKRLLSKLETRYALMTIEGVVIAWLEQAVNNDSDPVIAQKPLLVKVGEQHPSFEVESVDRRLSAFIQKLTAEQKARGYKEWEKEMEAAKIKRQKARAASLAADKRTIEKFRANARPLTEKQTVAINLALKTLYKSQNIILEFVQGSLKTEKLLVDIERWTIVVLKVGETEPRTVMFDVEVHDSGLLRETVTVSKVRLKYY